MTVLLIYSSMLIVIMYLTFNIINSDNKTDKLLNQNIKNLKESRDKWKQLSDELYNNTILNLVSGCYSESQTKGVYLSILQYFLENPEIEQKPPAGYLDLVWEYLTPEEQEKALYHLEKLR